MKTTHQAFQMADRALAQAIRGIQPASGITPNDVLHAAQCANPGATNNTHVQKTFGSVETGFDRSANIADRVRNNPIMPFLQDASGNTTPEYQIDRIVEHLKRDFALQRKALADYFAEVNIEVELYLTDQNYTPQQQKAFLDQVYAAQQQQLRDLEAAFAADLKDLQSAHDINRGVVAQAIATGTEEEPYFPKPSDEAVAQAQRDGLPIRPHYVLPKNQTLRAKPGVMDTLTGAIGMGHSVTMTVTDNGVDVDMPKGMPLDEQKVVWSRIMIKLAAAGWSEVNVSNVTPVAARRHVARMARLNGLKVLRTDDSGNEVPYPRTAADRRFETREANARRTGIATALGKMGGQQQLQQFNTGQLPLADTSDADIDMADPTPFGLRQGTAPTPAGAASPAASGAPGTPPPGHGAPPPPPPGATALAGGAGPAPAGVGAPPAASGMGHYHMTDDDTDTDTSLPAIGMPGMPPAAPLPPAGPPVFDPTTLAPTPAAVAAPPPRAGGMFPAARRGVAVGPDSGTDSAGIEMDAYGSGVGEFGDDDDDDESDHSSDYSTSYSSSS